MWREGDNFPGWIWATAVAGIITLILIMQPDVGMTSVVVLTWGFQMFLAGMPALLVIAAAAIAIAGAVAAYFFLESRVF